MPFTWRENSVAFAIPSSLPPRPCKSGRISLNSPNFAVHAEMTLSHSMHSRVGHRFVPSETIAIALCIPEARKSDALMVVDFRRATKISCKVRTSSSFSESGPRRVTSLSRSSRIHAAMSLSRARENPVSISDGVGKSIARVCQLSRKADTIGKGSQSEYSCVWKRDTRVWLYRVDSTRGD
jgi:hypothetical protein